jgi:predicted permease
MMIAMAGGMAGLIVAWILRGGLLLLVTDRVVVPDPTADGGMLAFVFGLTVITGLLLGILPMLRILHIDSTSGLKEQGRGLTASGAWLRAGKFVVAGQVALSLPLLMGAGLLVRTLENLQRVDTGFPKEKLLMVRLDVMTAGYAEPRRQALFDRLHARVRATPGVAAVSYSPHGMFLGSDSSDEVEVEGYRALGDDDRGSRYDQVGPSFLSTLGVPLRLGREIDERDHTARLRVCVINEAFAKKFFAGRNPIGLHVTQVYGSQRNTYEVIGVAANARKRALRGEIEPRYFVPLAQPIDVPRAITLVVRTTGDAATALPAVRRAVLAEDPNLPITVARPLTDLIDERMAQDHLLARLSIVFGVAALVLAAVGLFGVLSYGVARRTSEIGIRKALGAGEGSVIAMILRETSWVLISGLIGGALIGFATLRWIESRLFGLAPSDPAVLGVAVFILAIVAGAAAWLPARRASRVDPLVAMRCD